MSYRARYSALLQLRPTLIDATRISDNALVYIKRVRTDSDELKIALLLSPDGGRSDDSNHCAPILDHFQDADDSDFSYMVMPFLRAIDDPPFESVENVVGFVDQMLEVCALLDIIFP